MLPHRYDVNWTTPESSPKKAVDWVPVLELPRNAPTTNATLSLHQYAISLHLYSIFLRLHFPKRLLCFRSFGRYTPIRNVGTRHPVQITTAGKDAAGDTVYIFHFPENFVGWSELHGLDLPVGTTLTLSHGEQLICGGKPALVNCSGGDIYYVRFPSISIHFDLLTRCVLHFSQPFAKIPQQDNFTLAGTGNESFRPFMTYHGYQFVSIRGWPHTSSPPTLETLTGTIVHSDNEQIATLTFPQTQGGRLLAKINDAAVRSLLSNHHSVEEDCPTRERVGWTGDSQATTESAFRSLNMAKFYTKWMQDVQDAQNCAGLCHYAPPAVVEPAVAPSPPQCRSNCAMVEYAKNTHYGGKYYSPKNKSAETSAEACEAECLTDKACAGTTFSVRPVDQCMMYSTLIRRVTKEKVPTTSAVKCSAGSKDAANCAHFSPGPPVPAPPPALCCGAECGGGCGGGSLSSTVPYAKHMPPVDPTWPSNYAQELRLLYEYNNDMRVIIEHYTSLKQYVQYMRSVKTCPSCRAPTNTHPTVGNTSMPVYYMNGDWLEWRDEAKELVSSGPIMSSYHYILDLEILRDFAGMLSTVGGKLQPDGYDPMDHSKYAALAKAMRAEFQAMYLGRHNATQSHGASPETPRSFCTPCEIQGDHRECTCLTQDQNVPTLWRRMAPADAEAEVLGTVLDAITKPNGKDGVSAPGRITTGLVGTHLILPLLSRYNHSNLALQLAMGTELPSWGYMIENGATTLWESWSGMPDLSLRQPPSHNHHFLGGCVQWFHDSLVGLSQGNGTAFSDMRIAPDIVTSVELPSMAGVYDLPRGRVRVAWAAMSGQPLMMNVSLPPNTQATVFVPSGHGRHCARDNFRLSEGDTVLWMTGEASEEHADASGVQVVGCGDDGAVELRVGSGSYRFRVAHKTDDVTDNVLDPVFAELDRIHVVKEQLRKAAKNITALLAVGVKDGKIAWTHVAGMSDFNNSVPVTPSTRFTWASVSKTVISYAAMLLVDRGIVDLDRDVSDYIGFTLRHPQHLSTVITLRMLLTHMSSINDAAEWYALPLLCVRGDSALSNGDWLHTYVTESGQYYGGGDNINGSWFDEKPGHSYAYRPAVQQRRCKPGCVSRRAYGPASRTHQLRRNTQRPCSALCRQARCCELFPARLAFQSIGAAASNGALPGASASACSPGAFRL